MEDKTLFEERRISFLRGLERLSRAHGIMVHGCGCCGSPFLVDIHDRENGSDVEKTLHEDAGYATISDNHGHSEDLTDDLSWLAPHHDRWEDEGHKVVK